MLNFQQINFPCKFHKLSGTTAHDHLLEHWKRENNHSHSILNVYYSLYIVFLKHAYFQKYLGGILHIQNTLQIQVTSNNVGCNKDCYENFIIGTLAMGTLK